MASQSGGGESSDLSGSVEKQEAMALLASMNLSPERIQELIDGARGDPGRMLDLLFAQKESDMRTSSAIPPAKRIRSARVINAVAAEAKAVEEAAAKEKEEEVARLEELLERHDAEAKEKEAELAKVAELLDRYEVTRGIGGRRS